MTIPFKVAAFSGGVGGAKLVLGLSQICAAEELTVVVNTGDDFEHLGLHVSPDVDTVIYTLAAINNAETGWGRADETWSFMSALQQLGAPTWFQLGDKDLALNVYRTEKLRSGITLSDVTIDVAQKFGIRFRVFPMSNDPVRTMIETDSETISFQDYFVRQKCRPAVQKIRYQGLDSALPSPGLDALLKSSEIGAYVICPSNPYLSIDPMLSLPSVRDHIIDSPAPVVAVSPVVAGGSLKGPTGKIMGELGIPCTAIEVAKHYKGLINGIIIADQDAGDTAEIERLGVHVITANIVMKSTQDKRDLATLVLSFARQLASKSK
ncbi:MAG: 2-phospho-L-lactate transferase [Gammaproteobacteria bacterium]|nr:2-phospho-L-lactate transferase [Gammaproteobacteria bacterium]MDH3509784.1 2-phospho-L-lactate transferase [Gammaproteobacteria bacterium]